MMYNSKPKCNICENTTFREIFIEHSLKTRDLNRREMNIQNLPVEQCLVCGEKYLTTKSDLIIDSLKEMIQKQLQQSADSEKEEMLAHKDESILGKFKKIFK